MDITWDQIVEFSGGHSVGGHVIALVPGRGNVCFAKRTGQTFELTEDGVELADQIRAKIERDKAQAALAAGQQPAPPAAPPAAPKGALGAEPPKT
jgi:hypothetical protein